MAEKRALSAALEERLARAALLAEDGIRLLPATANPGPLGLYGFALTTFMLQGCYTTIVANSPANKGLVWGFGFFFGGLAQFVAGLLEYQRKNTFATVAFCCYGAFWMSLAMQNTLVAGGLFPKQTVGGEQLMLCLWGCLTFMLWLCTFSMNLVLSALFITLSFLFFFIAGGQENTACLKFAGCWGIMVACIAFYAGTATLMEEIYGKPILPLWPLGAINKRQAGHIGTMRRVDRPDIEYPEAPDAEKGRFSQDSAHQV